MSYFTHPHVPNVNDYLALVFHSKGPLKSLKRCSSYADFDE